MRRILIAMLIFLILNACGSKMVLHREPPPVESEVIRKADWEVDFRDVYFLDAKHGWIIGDKGTIIHTEDGGKNWERQESGVVSGLNKVFAVDDKEAWAIGDAGYILHTEDGEKWSIQKGYDWLGLHDVQFLNKKRGWAVGDAGGIFYTNDGGKR